MIDGEISALKNMLPARTRFQPAALRRKQMAFEEALSGIQEQIARSKRLLARPGKDSAHEAKSIMEEMEKAFKKVDAIDGGGTVQGIESIGKAEGTGHLRGRGG